MSTTTHVGSTQAFSNFPEIQNLKVCFYRGTSDHKHIQQVFNACKVLDGVEHTLTMESIDNHFQHLERSDPNKDMIFVELEGKPIAYARVGWYPEESGDRIYYSLGWVVPEHRKKGIGTAMLAFCERRLREIAAGHPPEGRKFYQSGYDDGQKDQKRLLSSSGYEGVRWFFEMTRPIEAPLPEVSLPATFEVRPVPEDRYRDVFKAQSEAFRDHWGFVEPSEEDYKRFLNEPTFDPSLWKVAWHGDEVAGMVLNFINREENEEFDRKRGYTEDISVRKPYRRQGLARYLLVRSVVMFREMGMKETALGVDADNPNQALNLYESVGYEVVKENVTCRKSLHV